MTDGELYIRSNMATIMWHIALIWVANRKHDIIAHVDLVIYYKNEGLQK